MKKKCEKEADYSRRERALSVVSSHSTLVPAAALIMPVCVCVCLCVCVQVSVRRLNTKRTLIQGIDKRKLIQTHETTYQTTW